MTRTLACAILLAFAGSAVAERLAPGDHLLRLEHAGETRTAILHVPPQAARAARLPVVLNFHGASANARAHQRYVRMDALADRAGFVVVYPNGTGPLRTRLLTWNAGTCCWPAAAVPVDDVGFIRKLLDELPRYIRIDSARVYATGLSNGAMLSYRLAVELSDRIAAIAPVAGAMALRPFAPRRAVPILDIHSMDDPVTLYTGGLGPPFPREQSLAMHDGVADTLARWATFMSCRSPVRHRQVQRGRAGSPAARHTATRIVYEGCRDGARIVHWRLTGAGHVWPGARSDGLPEFLGPGTDVIDANAEIWTFLRKHSLPTRR